MARTSKSFARAKPRFKPQPRVLVLCEDSKSCLRYLQDAARHFRAYAQVEILHCGNTDPEGIVKQANQRKKDYDEVYCAIDRDSHANFAAALELAKAHKINMVVSYPCYEFWLLLHFRLSRKPYAAAGKLSSCDCLAKDLCAEAGMADYDKGASENLFDALLDKLPTARQRAARVLAEALADGEMNPSTRLHELIARFEILGQPQPITV